MIRHKEHDYTVRGWGHDFVIDKVDGRTLHLTGWGTGIQAGDYLILPNQGRTTRYKVETVTYLGNPADMWSIVATWAPR